MTRIEVPVLIVGAGPVGLMGALLLARQGLETRVIDRRETPIRAPAAHVVNARTFEICRAVGVDRDALAEFASDPKDAGHAIWVTSLAGEEVGRLPFERQSDEVLRFTPTPLRAQCDQGTGSAEALRQRIAPQIEAIEQVWWEDLFPECLWKFRVKNFGPLIVGIDATGKNLYREVNQKAFRKLQESKEIS